VKLWNLKRLSRAGPGTFFPSTATSEFRLFSRFCVQQFDHLACEAKLFFRP
jgi:hypothetical protein